MYVNSISIIFCFHCLSRIFGQDFVITSKVKREDMNLAHEEFYVETQEHDEDQNNRRQLSNKVDLFTGQDIETFNGKVPEVICGPGYYRPPGGTNLAKVTGQKNDGCIRCPKGHYGSTSGLITSFCTGLCPLGKYSTFEGLTSVNQCQLCPPGRYGSTTGLTTPACSGNCPLGKYSSKSGLITVNDCLNCFANYHMHKCPWAIQPRTGQDQDHQHLEYVNFGIPTGFKDPIPYKATQG